MNELSDGVIRPFNATREGRRGSISEIPVIACGAVLVRVVAFCQTPAQPSSTEVRMRRIGLVIVLAVGLMLALVAAEAQQTGKVYHIGFLGPSATPAIIEPLRSGLRELGWIEGQNIVIEYRVTEGRDDRLPQLAAELVHLKVDVIVAFATPAAQAAKKATAQIPIVMTAVADPVGSGLVTNLAKPDRNVTGMTLAFPETSGKRLQLLREILPNVMRVAALWQSGYDQGGRMLSETEAAGKILGVKIQSAEVRDAQDLEVTLSAALKRGAEALIILPSPMFAEERKRLADFSARHRLPTIYPWNLAVEDGGLMSYGPKGYDVYRRAAVFVDKILRGAKPTDLPIEQPMKFELLINLTTAKTLGLTIPQTLLLRADQVIE